MNGGPEAQDINPGAARCPRCGEAFRCGAVAGEAECWCFEAPPVTPDPAAGDCLCPRCLRAAAGEPFSPAGAAARGRSPGSR